MSMVRPVRTLCAAGLVVLLIATDASAQRVSDMKDEANRLYEAGRLREALPIYDALLARKPKDIASLNRRGAILLQLNQPERALADFDRCVELGVVGQIIDGPSPPPMADHWTNRGIALVMLGRDDDAMSAFQRAIFLHRASSRYSASGLASDYCGVGQVFHRNGNDSRALDAFKKAIDANPSNPNGYVGQGLAYDGLGMRVQALEAFSAAIRIDPNHSRARGFRAATYERLGRIDDALRDYDETIRLDPNVSLTHRLRAAMLSRLGRQQDALRDLETAIQLDPTDAAALKDRGGVYNRMGEFSRAIADLDEAIRLDPKSSKAYQNRAAAYNGLGRYDAAMKDCERALDIDPTNAGALSNRGVALIALDRPEQAIESLSAAIRINSKLVPAYVTRAEACLRIGMMEQAASDYEDVARLDPEVARKTPALVRIHDVMKRNDGSTSTDSLAIRHALPQAAIELDRAHASRTAGDWSAAIASYTKSLQIDPNQAEALFFRGWSRLCAGEPGAETDACAALELKGWRDPLAPYIALLGIFAAREAGPNHDRQANDFLDEALANTRPPAWPSPIFRYLKRTITSTALLEAANDRDKLTEAHAVIGQDLTHRGERTTATEHLRWVAEEGVAGSIAKDFARETLRRITADRK